MKFKYYLRGLGIGIITTTIIMMITYAGQKTELTDEEIIRRAEALGMVMEEEPLFSPKDNTEDEAGTESSGNVENSELTENTEGSTEVETEVETEIETEVETETETEAESESESENESESEPVTTGESYRLVISSGAVPRTISNELEENGVVESASEFRQYLSDVGYATSIIAGVYDIPYGATYEEIYLILKAGPL